MMFILNRNLLTSGKPALRNSLCYVKMAKIGLTERCKKNDLVYLPIKY